MPFSSWFIEDSFEGANGTQVLGSSPPIAGAAAVWEASYAESPFTVTRRGDGSAIAYHPTSGDRLQIRDPGMVYTDLVYDSFTVVATFDTTGVPTPEARLYMEWGPDIWLSIYYDDDLGELGVTYQSTDDQVSQMTVTGPVITLKWVYDGTTLTSFANDAEFASEVIDTIGVLPQDVPYDRFLVAINMRSQNIIQYFSMTAAATSVDPPDPHPTGYNGLIKDMVQVKTLTQHDIPGKPYVPAKKAYYTYETQQVCGWVYQGTGHYIIVQDPGTGQSKLIWIPDGPGGAYAIWTCKPQQVRVYHPPTPAQPAVPPSSYTTTAYESGYNLGWNSGGRSDAVFFGDAAVRFKVSPSAVGVIVGMNIDDGTPVTYNGNTIDYGFYCAHGKARIMMNGVLGADAGAYTDATLFRIERVSDTISWQVDGNEVWYLDGGALEGAGWLEAALYAGNDFVFEPKIEYTSDSTEDTTGVITASLRRVTGYFTQGAHSEFYGDMAPMTSKLSAGSVVPSYTLINGEISIFSADFHSITGEVGTIDTAMRPMEGLWSDHKYAEISSAMHPMEGWLLATEDAEHASFTSLTKAYGKITTKQVLIATFRSTGQLLGVFSAEILEHAELLGRATLEGKFSFTSQQQAVLWSIAKTFDLAKVPEGDVETWVINMEGGLFGSTQYQNYDYNSYASFNGRHYGASLEGLVLLEGDTDDGEPIASVVSLGTLTGGNNLKKTFQECFLGVSGSGYMFVKVIAEGKEYIYKSRDWNPQMQTQRATFGKGMRTNYVTLEIYNGDGADFELDKVQFVVADMVRKI